MNTLFEDELSLADTNFASINVKFMEAVTESVEGGLLTEEAQDSLFTKAKKFFADLIAAMESFVKSIKSEVERKLGEKKDQVIYRKIYDQVKNESDPNKKYTVPDDKAILAEFKSANNRLSKYVKNFTSKEYKSTADIEKDIADFNRVYDECDKSITSVLEKKIQVSGSEYIKYVERNMTNRDNTIKEINSQKVLLDQLRIACDRAETKLNILGPDILQKKIGFFRKLGLKISAFFRKWIAKIISTIVFFSPL